MLALVVRACWCLLMWLWKYWLPCNDKWLTKSKSTTICESHGNILLLRVDTVYDERYHNCTSIIVLRTVNIGVLLSVSSPTLCTTTTIIDTCYQPVEDKAYQQQGTNYHGIEGQHHKESEECNARMKVEILGTETIDN